MTNNETSFFRDLQPFEALRNVVLPKLMAKRAATRVLTIWSAACSTGQEPYSLAMMIREQVPTLLGWNLSIVATDLSSAALARAQAGRYSQMEVNRGLPAALLLRYFRRDGLEWVIAEEVRRMITFRAMNLAEPWISITGIDLLLMRNVLIYFDDRTKRDILARAGRVLSRDGYLLLGSAESPTLLSDAYEPFSIERTVCYQLR
jgi:chemotaxis protein methyltransferase CheR